MNYPNFEEAQKELLTFLQENPHLVPFQRQLEQHVLQKAGKDPILRLQALSELIVDNLDQLSVELKLLNVKLLSLTKENKQVH